MKRVSGLFQKSLKNRSSKDLYFAGLVGPGTKSVMRCVSNAQLNEWVNQEVRGAVPEQKRRREKRAKKNGSVVANT